MAFIKNNHMCGICGLVNYKERLSVNVYESMLLSLQHRGPDDSGYAETLLDGQQVMLGHVRLSILDLSMAGHQPMSWNGLTICFNGEVYNFREIRDELTKLGHSFVSECDTEVVLHAFSQWSIKCVDRFIGMFAFAIFDSNNNKIWLCRDRAGVKPLFYTFSEDLFTFGSELKAIMAIPTFKRCVSLEALDVFLKVGYIPSETSIFEEAFKLDAGYWLEYDIKSKEINKYRYWSIDDYYNKPKFSLTYNEAKQELKKLFVSAFGYRLISDVPVGVFLSGGFDSSAVTSILTKELGIIPNTFTIGFKDHIDEAPIAEKISQLLGTNHTSYYCSEKDARDLITTLPLYYDEPFSDTSALPTMLVSKLSSQKVKVVLSADGGDEIFAGYTSVDKINRVYPVLLRVPQLIRNNSALFIRPLKAVIPNNYSRAHSLLDMVEGTFSEDVLTPKSWVVNQSQYDNSIINNLNEKCRSYDHRIYFRQIEAANNTYEHLLASDYRMKMKDEYLVKVDRATMAVSIEGREPMLDHRIAEFAAQLPWEYKYKDGVKKRILKDIVYDYLPQELMDKPKHGFSAPVMKWLRNELKEYAIENIQVVSQLAELGFNKKNVEACFENFLRGNDHLYAIVWRMIQMGAWYTTWMKK